MPKNNKKQTTYAFIDSQNLNLGVREAGWELDFKRFKTYLKEKHQVQKAYLFIGHIAGQESLYKFLEKSGYNLIFKPTLKFKKDKKSIVKGNVDAELVLHTMIQWKNFDKAIIISGDGDFHCLIEYLSNKHKLASIMVPNHRYSSLLRKFAKRIIQISLLKKKLEIDKKKREAFPKDETFR